MDYGSVGDGKTDDQKALLDTWAKACRDDVSPNILVPSGKTFLTSTVEFLGQCQSPIHVQVNGNILAPKQPWTTSNEGKWIMFRDIKGLTIDGSGQIDGNGAAWWSCRYSNQFNAPTAFAIESCNDVQLSGLRFMNSPKKHVTLHQVVWGHVSGISVTAPSDSPNTDGLYIQESQHILVENSNIGTGDDCISIGTGSSDVNITEINCGPGHDISIGSLGGDNSAATEQIYVSSCNFQGTTNGVRIKTWQGGSGYAEGITFENVNFTSVDNPIVIDQYYCGGGHNCPNKTSSIQISDVHYIRAMGTSSGQLAISLNCSANAACTGITMDHVNIQSAGGSDASAFCVNAYGTKKDPVIPTISCLN